MLPTHSPPSIQQPDYCRSKYGVEAHEPPLHKRVAKVSAERTQMLSAKPSWQEVLLISSELDRRALAVVYSSPIPRSSGQVVNCFDDGARMAKKYSLKIGMLVVLSSLLPLVSPAQQIDRTVLPVPEPQPPTITELDARNAKAPPRFEVKAPQGAPNVVIVFLLYDTSTVRLTSL